MLKLPFNGGALVLPRVPYVAQKHVPNVFGSQCLKRELSKSPRPSLESLLYDFHLLLQLPNIFGYEILSKMLHDLKFGQNMLPFTRSIVNAFVKASV